MTGLKGLSMAELAAFICETLKKEGLETTLSGGACAEIYSGGNYVTGDLDFVVNFLWPENKKIIERVMAGLGFEKNGRIYINESIAYSVEFPLGPLSIGEEYHLKPVELKLKSGVLSLLSPTDCVKDRLAGYFYGNDAQCLEQAVMVARNNHVDLKELRRWSKNEGKLEEFRKIAGRLQPAAAGLKRSKTAVKRPR